MKTLFCTIWVLALSLSALADDKYGYQKRDWIDKDKLNSYDARGRLLGHQKQDWIDKDKFNLFRRCP